MNIKYPAYQFALFRTIFGLYLLIHFLYLIPVASELWSSAGFIYDVKLNPTYGFFPNILYVLDTENMVTLFVVIMALLSFFVMIGFYRRTASLFLWYGWACLFHQNNLILNPGLPMVGWLLLALVLIPKGEGFGLNKEEASWYMPPILFWGAWLMLGVAYTISALLIVDFSDLTFAVLMLHLFTFDARWFKMGESERIVIFDGVCGFCNKSIDLLIKIDDEKLFKYTSLQGEYVKKLDISKDLDSIVFYEGGKIYYKSTAVLKILRSLGGVGILANVFLVIPRFVRDFIYDVIAKYRYNIFGKMESCRMPKVGEQELFLG